MQGKSLFMYGTSQIYHKEKYFQRDVSKGSISVYLYTYYDLEKHIPVIGNLYAHPCVGY